jgi:hypothetical protein
MLQGKNLAETYTFFLKKDSHLKPAEDLDSCDNELLSDYYQNIASKLDLYQNNRKTNITNSKILHSLPMMSENISQHLLKGKGLGSSNTKKDEAPAGGNNNNNNFGGDANDNLGFLGEMENEEMDNLYKFKLFIKLSIFFLVFSSYFKGIYFYCWIGVLLLYYWLKIKDNKMKLRARRNNNNENNNANRVNIPPPVANLNNVNPLINNVNNVNVNNNNADPNAAANTLLNNELNAEGQPQLPTNIEPQAAPPATEDPVEVKLTPKQKMMKFYKRAEELCTCFTLSFFPSWSVEMYLENPDHNNNNANATGAAAADGGYQQNDPQPNMPNLPNII